MAQNPSSLRELLGDRIDAVELIVEARQKPGDRYDVSRFLLDSADAAIEAAADEIAQVLRRRERAEKKRLKLEMESFLESERLRQAMKGGV